jgi:hypothetical protein
MRINGLYKINFDPETKVFTPERVEIEHRLEESYSLAESCYSVEEVERNNLIAAELRDNQKQFLTLWEEYASEEDKKWSNWVVAKQAKVVKAGEYYFQFWGCWVIDCSKQWYRLLERYNIHCVPSKTQPGVLNYFWPSPASECPGFGTSYPAYLYAQDKHLNMGVQAVSLQSLLFD